MNIGKQLSKYRKLEELRPYVAEFKEYYYQRMLAQAAANPQSVLNDFNKDHPDYMFWPYAPQYRKWQNMWNIDINAKRSGMSLAPIVSKNLVTVRDKLGGLIAPPPTSDIEAGSRTLAGELMNDAMSMLEDDKKRGDELYTDDILIKRRKYILSVYNFVSRNSMSAEMLNIKKQENTRENTNFLMDLLRRSTAGKISKEEMSLLRSSTKIETNEPSIVGENIELVPGVDSSD